MAIQAKSAEETKNEVAAKKAAGYLPQSFEIDLPEDVYEGESNGLYKTVPYENANGKGLLILACCTVEVEGETKEVDVPIRETQIGQFNEYDTINFEVFRKDGLSTNPKRVKFISESADVNVNGSITESPEAKISRLDAEIKALPNGAEKNAKKAELKAFKESLATA